PPRRGSRILTFRFLIGSVFPLEQSFGNNSNQLARKVSLGLGRQRPVTISAVDLERILVGVEPQILAHAVGGNQVEPLGLELAARRRLEVARFSGKTDH